MTGQSDERVRLNPHISLMVSPDGLVLHDHVESWDLVADDIATLAGLLARSTDPLSPRDWLGIAMRDFGIPDQLAEEMFEVLVQERVLVPASTRHRERWSEYHWESAYDYHWHTRAIPKPDWSTRAGWDADLATMREFIEAEEPPSNYLDRPAIARVGLPTIRHRAEGPIRDTITASDPGPLDLETLTSLLALTFGENGKRRLPVTGEHVTKTTPSGGSRHPTEAHVCVLDVVGVAPGIYHYSVRDHALDLLDSNDPADFVARHVVMLRGRVGFRPRAVVLLTSTVERSMFRYRDSRSYRVLYLDVGHIVQTFAYVASTLCRPTYRGYAVRAAAVANRLGLDPLLHLPVAYGALA